MVKFSALLLAALLGGASVFAQAPKTPLPKADPALLEFLGSWQTSDGKWVDPMTFARIDPDKLTAERTRHDGKPLPSSKAAGHPGNTPPGGEETRGVWYAG